MEKLPLKEPMNYKMPRSENIYNIDTSTFDLIKEGKRTSTTRGYWFNVVKGGLSINDLENKLMTFISPSKETIDVVIIKIHRITKKDRNNEEFLNQWSNKEGWKKDYLLKNTKIGEYQVEFKLWK